MIRFLVVEDEESLQVIYEGELSHHFKDAHIDLASDGAEGLEFFSKNEYDLVITDGRMPNMGGLEMAEKMKAARPECHIVLVTGFTDDMHDEEKFSVFTQIKSKPIDFDAFLLEIAGLIQ